MDGIVQRLWEQCRDSLRGWKSAILYFGKEALEEAYRRGVEDGKRESKG